MAIGRVVVVEDDLFTSTLIVNVLIRLGFIAQAADSARRALAIASESVLDAAVLDIDLGPGPTGVDVALALRNQNPDLGLVFLTTLTDPRLLRERHPQLPAGAVFLTKSKVSDVEQLRTAIMSARQFPHALRKPVVEPQLKLTDHQISVLRLVSSGHTNAQIAETLEVGTKAVEATLTKLFSLFGISQSANSRVLLSQEYVKLSGKQIPHV